MEKTRLRLRRGRLIRHAFHLQIVRCTGIKERLEGILVPERCGDDEFPEMVVFEEVAEGG
jgi:hypothetical protein